MICLDTNAVIGLLSGRPPSLRTRLAAEWKRGTEIRISTIVVFELRYGIAKSTRREFSERLLDSFLLSPVEALSFEVEDAEHAGNIRAHLQRAGTPIGHHDLLIAAQARRRAALLVTANTREFERVPGLRITDWAT